MFSRVSFAKIASSPIEFVVLFAMSGICLTFDSTTNTELNCLLRISTILARSLIVSPFWSLIACIRSLTFYLLLIYEYNRILNIFLLLFLVIPFESYDQRAANKIIILLLKPRAYTQLNFFLCFNKCQFICGQIFIIVVFFKQNSI